MLMKICFRRLKNIALASIFLFYGILALAQEIIPEESRWSIVASYTITGKASGLAWDGQYLYFGIYGANGGRVFRFDPVSGQEQLLFNNPQISNSYGMTYDGQYLWIIDQPSGSANPALAKKLSMTGEILETFPLPDHYMSGIAYDNGNFWACTYYPDPGKVYKVTPQSTVLKQFVPPNNQPWDACLQGQYLWIADYYAYNLCKVDTITGAVVSCHPSQSQRPAGVVWDGSYLWYVDGPLGGPSKLYKVDLGGSGTPQIHLPVTTYSFGNVAIGDSAVWNMFVGNTGTAPLSVNGLQIPGSAPIFSWTTFPKIVSPGQYTSIQVIYKPTVQGPLNVVMGVLSNDPITPVANVTLTGNAVYIGPTIQLPTTSYNYGNVRVNAWTRWYFDIKNVGNTNLIVTQIVSDNPAFTIDPVHVFPMTIVPLETRKVGVWFNPIAPEVYQGILTIFSNDLMNPAVPLTLTGTGLEQPYPMGEPFWYYLISTSWDNSPKAIKSIADISGDGVDDVIVCSEDNYIRCFNGNSSGVADIFWQLMIYSGNVYQQMALDIHPDINGDGYEDVVVGTTGGDRSVVAISGKTGQQIWKFQTSSMWGSGGWVYQVDARRDYNGDGVNDVLAAAGNDSNGTGPRRAFCLNGLTGTLLWDNFITGPGFSVISIPDVNGDGTPDAFAGGSNASESQGRVVCINGANGSTFWTLTTSGTSVWALDLLDDITGDGIPELVAGTFNGYYYAYNPVNGSVVFSGSMGGSPIITRIIRLDDVNGDGYSDFVIGSSSNNCVVVNGFNGNNIWIRPLAEKPWNVARINDINGDAINDVIAGTLYQNNFVYFLDGTTGNELKSINYLEAVDALTTIPDINGDLSMEVVVGGRNGKVYCYSGGTDTWTHVPEVPHHRVSYSMNAWPNPFNGLLHIVVHSPVDDRLQVSVISAGGLAVRDLGTWPVSRGENILTWNGCNEQGLPVQPGVYFVVLTNSQYFKAIKVIRQ